jgi:hypothetical protein
MNELFQNYVHAALEAHFQTMVKQQDCVGHLLKLAKGRIAQYADYSWHSDTTLWIGDAKYKHLAAGQAGALRFTDLPDSIDCQVDPAILAGRILTPGDIRQLTVYAELARHNHSPTPEKVNLALLYPFVGTDSQCIPDHAKAWTDSDLWLIPVRVIRQSNRSNILPPLVDG